MKTTRITEEKLPDKILKPADDDVIQAMVLFYGFCCENAFRLDYT